LKKGNFKHPLNEILFLAITCSICGIVDWDEMEIYGKEQIRWFRKYFPYKKGIPSHDTISRLFAKLDPEKFCKYFTEWVQALRKGIDKEVIAIDGKAVKGSAERSKGKKSLYYVSAYASENQLVLCQEVADEKSNEITAVPKLLDMIECKGAIITVDALNCQTKIVEKVIEKQADYLFAIKNNQGELYEQVVSRFNLQQIDSQHIEEDMGHGRVEKRKCSVIENLSFVDNAVNWLGMKSIVKIESERYQKATGKTQSEIRYYISSLAADAQLINRSVRSHWSIENKLHWMLDVSFKEDASRKRKDHSTHNYGMICKIALNMIKQANGKGSYKKQKFKALINDAEREALMGLC
jgi:predicted transposase YbfD/YdcC